MITIVRVSAGYLVEPSKRNHATRLCENISGLNADESLSLGGTSTISGGLSLQLQLSLKIIGLLKRDAQHPNGSPLVYKNFGIGANHMCDSRGIDASNNPGLLGICSVLDVLLIGRSSE